MEELRIEDSEIGALYGGETRTLTLTAFERRALELFASGLARAEIARELNRAPKTISNSLTAAKEKLGARTLVEAAVLLTEVGR